MSISNRFVDYGKAGADAEDRSGSRKINSTVLVPGLAGPRTNTMLELSRLTERGHPAAGASRISHPQLLLSFTPA
jgi:hypothetical protein